MIKKRVFDAIYEKYSRDVKNNIRRHVKNDEMVEDICQEVFDGFYKKMDELDCKDLKRIRSWLLVASEYKVKDCIRESARDRSLVDKVINQEFLCSLTPEIEASPEELMVRKESVLLKRQILEEFKKRYPVDFEMMIRREQGEDSEAVAESYGITVNNLYTKIYRLKSKLRAELKRRQGEYGV